MAQYKNFRHVMSLIRTCKTCHELYTEYNDKSKTNSCLSCKLSLERQQKLSKIK